MGLIQIENMEFYAYHGCFKEEKIIGNKFVVDAWIDANCEKAAQTDDINDAINYQIIYEIICEEMKVISNLLENIAKRIIDKIYISFPNGIDKITIKVSKLNPPLEGVIGKVSVTLSR
ncbi:MAG: dihydroneopterin aldolase [Bacteroidota bacterium]